MEDTVAARFLRDDGTELLVDETDWGLTAVDGAAAPSYEIFTENNAVGDGATVTGKRTATRELQIEASVMSTSHNAVLRAGARAFFNPKHSYKIFLSYQGCTRWLTAELAAFRAPVSSLGELQTFSALFLAVSPYWQSVDDFGQDIASETPRWGFPYLDHPALQTLVSLYNFAREVVFDYDGDVPAAPLVTMTADGEVRNPCLHKDGAFVRLLDTLAAGDVVRLTLRPVSVTKNGRNVLNRVDRTSNFSGIRMTPGINTVSYTADYGDNNLHVVLHYNKQYTGV